MVKVFERVYLSDETDYVERVVAHAVACAAETVVLHGTLINHSGTEITLTLQMEGSYDGQVWQTIGLTAAGQKVEFNTGDPTSPATKNTTAIAVDYAFLRVRATIDSDGQPPDGKALFDAELVFLHQKN